MNRADKEQPFILNAAKVGINPKTKLRDLWKHKNLGKMGNEKTFTIPKHGIVVLKTW